jgi:hypothetical protein
MPDDPLRLQVRDRLKLVLESIKAGEDYFATPEDVRLVDVLSVQVKGYPTYSVHPDSGGRIEEQNDNCIDESYTFVVKGMVKDPEDPGAACLKAIRDVRKAIDDDYTAGGTGSLQTLVVRLRFPDPPTTDNGLFSDQGLAYFEQRVEVTISGNYGSL